jgi:imidazolonepropionase-like amidohydrolase
MAAALWGGVGVKRRKPKGLGRRAPPRVQTFGWRQEPGLILRSLTLLAGGLLAVSAAAQSLNTERPAGLREAPPTWHAFTDARLVLAPGQVVERGTLLVRDGRIVAVGANVAVPAGARVWPLNGRSVYAGFIDLASPLGVPAALREPPPAPVANPFDPASNRAPARPEGPAPVARSLSLRNPMVRPEQQVASQWEATPEAVAALRQLGFTAVLAAPGHGVLRGQGALVALRDGRDAKDAVLASAPSQHLGFDLLGWGRYPSSLMGATALLRQTLLDARWYGQQAAGRAAPNASLAALQPLLKGEQLVVAQARDEQDLSRWLALRDEFGLRQRFVLQGTGHEYRHLQALQKGQATVLVPLAFPEAPAVAGDAGAQAPLHELQHWEAAPSNAAWLAQAGVPVALTAAGLRRPERDFWPRVRQAVQRGWRADAALAALTTTPAALLNESARLGTLAPGKLAHAVVMSGDPFTDPEAEPVLSVVGEQVHLHAAWRQPDARGRWILPDDSVLTVAGPRAKPTAQLGERACTLALDDAQWQLGCGDWQVVAQQSGERLTGTLRRGGEPLVDWQAKRSAPHTAKPAAVEAPPTPITDGRYPYGAYGIAPAPAETVLIRGATVWTQGPQGTLAAADVLVQDGRIAAVGPTLAAPAGAQVIEARGLHLTPGLVDAHSHIATARGVNEGSDSVTAEVRVADALDATDINLYRQLAGGVTTANLLHGSSNAIGGQSAVVKLRWGQPATGLLFSQAPPSNKFALGENVKQSNYGNGERYPQTRAGVEQLLRDAFAQAEDYAARRAADPTGTRRDLRLEALAELRAGTRHIHIHSYRADEILMFIRLAREKQLKVAAFQHVLEGYKVAPEIASLGAGASSFADWWGFKAETFDGVVGNPAMLVRAGVLTSVNSDDAELARRLNTEAAKSVRVGGLSPEEALALVTRNPARQLGVDRWIGSVEPGKHADLVLWSGPPLSAFSTVQSTWVDGRRLYDRRQDALLRLRDAKERERLLMRVAQAMESGDKKDKAAAPARALDALLARSRALARIAHADYHDGQAAHECTEEHLQ